MKIKNKIVLIGFLWLFFIFIAMKIFYQEYRFPDEFSYSIAAKQLYHDFLLNDHRPFLINAIFGIPLFFGAKMQLLFFWGIFVNALGWIFTILLIFRTVNFFLTEKVAYICSLIYIFLAGNLFIIFHLLSETVFIFMMLWAIYFLAKYQKLNDTNDLISAFLIFVLSVLVKPIATILIAVFVVIYLKLIVNQLKFIKWYSFFILAVSFSIVFFQIIYMKKLYGIYTISTVDSATYYNYLGTRADCLAKNIEFVQGKNQRVIDFKKLNYKQQKNVANQDFINQLSNNSINLGKAFFENLLINSTKGSASVHGLNTINENKFYKSMVFLFKVVSKLQNCILSFFGFFLSFYFLGVYKQKNKFENFLSITIPMLLFLSAISSDQGDRLHLIVFPLIIVLISLFFKQLFAPLQK